jgi:hypothetical protein
MGIFHTDGGVVNAVERVLQRLGPSAVPRRGGGDDGGGGGWIATCPACKHERCLHLSPGDGCALVHCFAGCSFRQIFTALDLRAYDFFDHARSRR